MKRKGTAATPLQIPLFREPCVAEPPSRRPPPDCSLSDRKPRRTTTRRDDDSPWEEVLAHVRGRLHPTAFRNWFQPTRYVATTGQALRVQVPTELFSNYLTRQYGELLGEALRSTGQSATRVEFEVSPPVRDDGSEPPSGALTAGSCDPDAPGPTVQPQSRWPQLEPDALYGLPGRIVHALEPHTEADPVALLVHVLVAAGTLIGRSPHFTAEGSRHFTNLYAVLVGQSSKGRKGSAWSRVRRLLEPLGEFDPQRHIKAGLTSGEGLMWAVRDPISKQEPVRQSGRVVGYQEVIADPGVADKRLLVVEEEFASVLHAMSRGGNTLSAQIRTAWDTGNIRLLAKNTSTQATGAHISILGHITCTELRRLLGNTELANGFANRFLWLAVRRSKLLPDGGSPDDELTGKLARQLGTAIARAQGVTSMGRDEQAHALWREAYPRLSSSSPGLLGDVTSRAEAQVMRVACLYALLDNSPAIKKPHLAAALALWNYADASARWVFADLTGDPFSDELLAMLRRVPDGLTRTEIRDRFARHRSIDLARALQSLEDAGLARRQHLKTSGRPAERWLASAERITSTAGT